MEKKRISVGRVTFQDIIEKNNIYVDKTAPLAMMIEGSPKTKTWFFARPRRFGKSLTVSTLKSIFSGEKELFKGLAIENRLDEELFAPRPVIHLDMSQTAASSDFEEFERVLRKRTVLWGIEHGIELPMNLPPYALLTELVEGCARKYNRQVAILIDEYDAPITALMKMNSPDKANAVRNQLCDYYSQLISLDEYTSFVFVTGVTEYIGQEFFATFNNFTDISLDPNYGVLAGFTHEEVKSYYKWQIQEVAESQKMTVDNLLAKMKDFYDGFCFDGKQYVYNPFSIFQFFEAKIFKNFWFNSVTSNHLILYFRKNRLTVEEFRGITVPRDRIKILSKDGIQDPKIYLNQFGYLSLRPSPDPDAFNLDYPNFDVLRGVSRNILRSLFNFSHKADNVLVRLRKAAKNRNPAALVAEINALLYILPYDDFKDLSLDENFFRGQVLTLFHAACLAPRAELHGNPGKSDFAFNYSGQNWVLNIKLNIDAKRSDGSLAKDALKQILDNNFGGSIANPILLGIVVNFKRRLILAWESQDGILEGAERKSYSIDQSKPKASLKPA